MREQVKGRVYLVGAGPGDPELLTLRAARLLKEADTVVHDRLIHPGVLEHARPHARLIYVGKEGGGESVRQEDIHTVLIAQARLGRRVVRLKGGDPFVFGRGAEEALALEAAGIPYEVVPGLSAGIAVPASAAIPVTHRELSGEVTFATAHRAGGPPDWDFLARAQTLVLFMAGDRLEEVVRALVSHGRAPSTPAALVEAGTWEHQRVVEAPLGHIALAARRDAVGSPALLVVGEVVALRSRLPSLAARAPSLDGHALPRLAEAGHE
jgi:uroporphyrin-III C-methyltransferase